MKTKKSRYSLQELSALVTLRRRILNAVQDNYGISDAVQEFLGWSEEEAEDADGTNWDDVVDAIVRDSKLRSQFDESSKITEERIVWKSGEYEEIASALDRIQYHSDIFSPIERRIINNCVKKIQIINNKNGTQTQ